MAKHKCDHLFPCDNKAITYIQVSDELGKYFCYQHFLSFIGFLVREALKHPEYAKHVSAGVRLSSDAKLDAIMEEIEKEEPV